MATTAEIARRYFDALAARDIEGALACWAPGGVERLGGRELLAPEGIRAHLTELFGAFPDFRFQIVDCTTSGRRCAVRWRASATFAGPGRFDGFQPNGAPVELAGCDLVSVAEERIVASDAYVDSGALARQLGLLPTAGSAGEARLAALANLRTRVGGLLHGAEPEWIAEGVWVVRGGRPRTMNVYLIEDEGGVTMFDAGISAMRDALRMTAARMGGLRRVVLGHADADHRGAAHLGAPVLCHPAEREAAESEEPLRPYWRLEELRPVVRSVYPALLRSWDGGAVKISETVVEGDEIAGFRVIELPGHAPGLIGLFRERDRLALASDCVYTIDPETSRRNAAHVPHRAFNHDTEQARASIRKLAALGPAIVWAGHADPVAGEVQAQLERAAQAPA